MCEQQCLGDKDSNISKSKSVYTKREIIKKGAPVPQKKEEKPKGLRRPSMGMFEMEKKPLKKSESNKSLNIYAGGTDKKM